jgi:phosphatidylglycerol---prolipoprotein diacylglyceryl transferase
MLPIVQLGPLAIPVPGLVLLGGFWLGLTLAERNASRRGLNPNHLSSLVLVMLISGAIGGRLAYAIRYWEIFSSNLTGLLSRDFGIFDISGGLACALIAGGIYGQRKKMPFLPTLDGITPLLAVMGVSTALAHLASGSAFGAPTELPWSIDLWGAARHPSQVYELLAAVAILAMTWPGRGLVRSRKAGLLFLSFVAMTAGARLFLEAFRGDSQLIIYGFRSAQLIAWLVLAACLVGIIRLNHNSEYVLSE